jgi:hypothetical protein
MAGFVHISEASRKPLRREERSMTTTHVRYLTLVTALAGASGCQVVGDIFKAGMWVGVIVVGVVIAAIFGIARMFSR